MADKCYAPMFAPNNVFACIFLRLFYLLLVVMLIVATLGLILLFESGRCLIKQYLYRAQHCTEGNREPNVPI